MGQQSPLPFQQDLQVHQTLEALVDEVEVELRRLSTCDPWVQQVPFLVQLPGLGVLSAMRVLAAIGQIARFPSAKHLVGSAGMGAAVHDSGQTHRGGHITKEGRSDLRAVMVEAAWVAVEHHPHWKAQFECLSARIGKQKAIVAIARKLLVTIWHVLRQQEADCNAQLQAVSRTLLTWIASTREPSGKRRDRLLLPTPISPLSAKWSTPSSPRRAPETLTRFSLCSTRMSCSDTTSQPCRRADQRRSVARLPWPGNSQAVLRERDLHW
jgi:transposase